MEADLRSEERSKRTLHWFVDGRQQTIFLSNLPATIQFGVCISLLHGHDSQSFAPQISWNNTGYVTSIAFLSFAEVGSPTTERISGEKEVQWKEN